MTTAGKPPTRTRIKIASAAAALVATTAVVTATLTTGTADSDTGTSRPSAPFVAENTYQQIAYDAAVRSGQRSASQGLSARTYAAACQGFAYQVPSNASDEFGETVAALAGCADGLETYYPGE